MTLDEARLQLQGRIEGVIKAMQIGGQNGKPIFLPNGQPAPAMGVRPPPLGDLLTLILQTMHLELQYLNALGGMLADGFNLSDQEAGRIADLLLTRIQALDNSKPAAVGLGHENVPSADSSQPERTQGHQ